MSEFFVVLKNEIVVHKFYNCLVSGGDPLAAWLAPELNTNDWVSKVQGNIIVSGLDDALHGRINISNAHKATQQNYL